MIILVCGGREYRDFHRFCEVLNEYAGKATMIIHGDARGADALAGLWARMSGAQEVKCPANWEAYGKRAGYVRNQAMAALSPSLVVAFPGGNGTRMMVDIATRSGIEVRTVDW